MSRYENGAIILIGTRQSYRILHDRQLSCSIISTTPNSDNHHRKSSIRKYKATITCPLKKEQDKKIILINRPEIPQKETDKNLFWYVTQNGKLCKCFQAYSKTWTNFLTFADKGDYTVTLVIDYDDATGEYTPISNTIEYTVE